MTIEATSIKQTCTQLGEQVSDSKVEAIFSSVANQDQTYDDGCKNKDLILNDVFESSVFPHQDCNDKANNVLQETDQVEFMGTTKEEEEKCVSGLNSFKALDHEIFDDECQSHPSPAQINHDLDLCVDAESKISENEIFDKSQIDASSEKNLDESIGISKHSQNTLKSQKIMKEERKKIYSEGQRMIRESSVSLPVRKPSQMSLSDFLNRKKKVPPPLKISQSKYEFNSQATYDGDSGPVTDSPSVLGLDGLPFEDSNEKLLESNDSELPKLHLQDSESFESKETAEISVKADMEDPSLKDIKTYVMQNKKNFTPKLNHYEDFELDIIENVNTSHKSSSGIDLFKNRFAKHSQKKKKCGPKSINLSIVQKEVDKVGNVCLKQNSINVNQPANDDCSWNSDSNTAKLCLLKDSLKSKIRAKREEGRLKRVQLSNLDNENFDEEVETDLSDSENEFPLDDDIKKELFDEEAQNSNGEEDEDESNDNVGVQDSIIVDEAEESGKDSKVNFGESEDSDEEEFTIRKKRKAAVIDEDDESQHDCPTLPISESKSEEVECATQQTDECIDNSNEETRNAEISSICSGSISKDDDAANMSFELQGTSLAPYQNNLKRDLSISSDHETSFFGTPLQNFSEPIENSQDLFNADPEWNANQIIDRSLTNTPHFKTSDLKDENKTMSCRKSLILHDSQSDNDNMTELLGLCSGKFIESHDTFRRPKADGSQDMKELLDLCSGNFCHSTQQTPDAEKSVELVNSLDNDQNQLIDEEDQDSDSEDELESASPSAIGKKFFENEAELSGSEMDSDEDLDIAEEDDILDEELGDRDVLPSDDELRDQVGRVHLKSMMDRDKKELRLYQEMYLEDGDLHGDGSTRQRSFRWRNIDNDEVQDINDGGDSSGEEDDGTGGHDSSWRLERHQREKWIQESNIDSVKEDVEILKTANKIIDKQESFRLMQSLEKENSDLDSQHSSGNFKLVRKGSFLSRDRKSLDKIAQITCKASNTCTNGIRQSKKFLFSSVSPSADKSLEKVSKVITKKSSNGDVLKKAKINASASSSKGQGLKRSNSLFSYL